jgi:hypothetical protein
MTHEPECREGYQAGCCICEELRVAYRRGYNDHARTVQHWQDTHGAYRQHGEGENP